MAQLAIDSQPSVFSAAPGSDEGTLVGRNPTTPLGFYGKTPIAQPTITAANSAAGTAGAVLVALGLARQIP